MATSNNPRIQKLMDEVDALDEQDGGLEAKLNLIAQKIAEEQRKVKAKLNPALDEQALTDPGEAFACEGCQ